MDDIFLHWHNLKSNINKSDKKVFFNEREIWGCHLGQNIGHEQNGKNEYFTRPVLIVKKFNNGKCWILPLSSKVREGAYYKNAIVNSKQNSILLDQLKTISSKRLTRRFYKLEESNFYETILALAFLLLPSLSQNLKDLLSYEVGLSRQVVPFSDTAILGCQTARVDKLYPYEESCQLQKSLPTCYNRKIMKSSEIRSRFLKFFEKPPRNHAVIGSAPLVPENDPSVLFNTAGMQPLVPYLLGEKHPLGTRLVNIQKCVRTVDIEEIGDKTHNTFFEMMGNWSLGDYFKREAIEWSYELLTNKEEGFGLDPKQLYVTCFEGDENAPKDEESAGIWREIFEKNNIEGNRIFFLPAEKNWWSAGDNGPCGADTEMFYDVLGTHGGRGLTHEEFLAADDRQEVVEIWNDVFMEYEKKDGKIIGKLASKNVDTGSGLERVTMVLQGKDNIFDTDLFSDIRNKINELMDEGADSLDEKVKLRASRIVADHIRTAVMLISDGVLPANSDQGYVLRRIIRRAVRFADVLNLKPKALFQLADIVCNKFEDTYENVGKLRETIKITIDKEEQKFRNTLNRGMKELNSIIQKNKTEQKNELSAQDSFLLYESYGFPIELTKEIALEENMTIDSDGFAEALKKHQELSRANSGERFKGGLGDTSDMSLRYHTATHLLHQALRDVLGTSVSQKGSNITPERLRFDFAHTEKLTNDQKKQVEDIVNEKILADLPVKVESLSKDEAEKTGALHFFGDKYGDMVTVYYIGDTIADAYSKEYCGGPHVTRTGELNPNKSERPFTIQKEEAVAQGVRRIKATLS